MQSRPAEKPPLLELGTRLDGIDYIERPGVYAIIENNHKQIAVIETSTGYFLPGGSIDSGEGKVAALKREILEEIGYDVLVLAEMGEAVDYIKARVDGKYYQIHGNFYQVQLASKRGDGIEKHHRLVWLSPEHAIQVLTRQSQAWAIQQMAKEY